MWWLLGLPFGNWLAPALLTLSVPNIDALVGMVAILAGMGLVARRALNY
jgi:hypothetical protein